MMIHRCSVWRNEGPMLVHASEWKCRECRLFITAMIGLGSVEVNLGDWYCLSSGVTKQAKVT